MNNERETPVLEISDAQTARGAIRFECYECGKGYATRDEMNIHEIKTDHDVEGY